jgi:hypothetical protein
MNNSMPKDILENQNIKDFNDFDFDDVNVNNNNNTNNILIEQSSNIQET